MVNLQSKKLRAIIDLKMICVIFIFIINFASCNYKIRPIVFSITSQGGDPPGNDHQISFDLAYVGQHLTSMKFPANGFYVPYQCPNGGNQFYSYCDFKSGQATPIPNAGQIQIKQNESFHSLHWNVYEKDFFDGDDSYTMSISSSEWKLSSNQCTPYEIRMAVDIQSQVKHKQCFSVNLGISAEASISASAFSGLLEIANANVKAEMLTGWQRCSEWITPPKTYVLYSSVTNTAPYPNVSYSIPACSSSRIAETDGYSNKLYTYNAALSMIPTWIKWDQRSYIVEPLANNIGNYTFNLSVFGTCGAKNLTTHINVIPEAKYPTHNYTVDACAAAYLPVIDNYGNIAVPASSAATVNWIISNNQTHIATPTLAQIGNHNAILNLKSPCGSRNVSATIKVNPEKPYPNISVNVYACSTFRLKVKNSFGVPVPPSGENLSLKSWVSKDSQDYIAKPFAEDKGIHSMTLSMFSYCGARNITATVNVTQSQDFLVDKKVIFVKNIDKTSYHTLTITPQDKEVVCSDLTLLQFGTDFDWVSMNEKGNISLTPTGLSAGLYSFTGICADKCGKYKLFGMDIYISANTEKLLSSVGLAMATVFVAMLF